MQHGTGRALVQPSIEMTVGGAALDHASGYGPYTALVLRPTIQSTKAPTLQYFLNDLSVERLSKKTPVM